MVINFKKTFWKDYEKFPTETKSKIKARLSIFKNNSQNSILKNHKLQGEFYGHRSINITADIRAIYYEIDSNTVSFIRIGTHSELYQ